MKKLFIFIIITASMLHSQTYYEYMELNYDWSKASDCFNYEVIYSDNKSTPRLSYYINWNNVIQRRKIGNTFLYDFADGSSLTAPGIYIEPIDFQNNIQGYYEYYIGSIRMTFSRASINYFIIDNREGEDKTIVHIQLMNKKREYALFSNFKEAEDSIVLYYK